MKKISSFILFVSFILLLSCDQANKLDSDGGYYDEKLKKYLYVKPSRTSANSNKLQIHHPNSRKVQQVVGTVAGLRDFNQVWLRIDDRQSYMILSEPILPAFKDDKGKHILVFLKYVNPRLTNFKSSKKKNQWLKQVQKKMERNLINKNAVAVLDFKKKAKIFNAVIITDPLTDAGDSSSARNFNLWMVSEGLSYYVIPDQNKPEKEAHYKNAQEQARKNKRGLWGL